MTALMDVKVKTWSPAVPCKISDNIISSQFTSQKVFVPSYEKEKRPCIEQLLTNEYQRMWWQEKEAWDKRHTSRTKTTTKKLLQRQTIKKKPSTTPAEKPKSMRKPRKKKETTTIETDEIAKEKEQKEVLEQTEGVTRQEEKCSQENKKIVIKQ